MLVKAVLTHLESLECLIVQWNPTAYSVDRVYRFADGFAEGLAEGARTEGGVARFETRLLLDSTEEDGPTRDLRGIVERLESWASLDPRLGRPPTLLFSWGSFRFRGRVERLREEWVRFDPDGTPTRAWLDLVLKA